jgi:hypothetical protein
MKAISRFEYNLLRILHFFLQRVPLEQVRTPLVNRSEKERPRCLSRTAVELVQEALAKGTTELVARAGGWRRERFLRHDQPVEGRLWERTPPGELGLTFSAHSLDFLLWITAVKPSEPKNHWAPLPEELTVGDWLLLFHAYKALRDTDVGLVLRTRRAFARHVLCRLAFPEDFAANQEEVELDFSVWTTAPGSCILEAMQQELAGRWVEVERQKPAIADWQQLRALGRSQEHALAGFLEAANAARRRDLARFALRAAAEVLGEGVAPGHFLGGLQGTGPRMADRAETNQAALALVRQLERFKRWEREARRDGYFDEGYARSQLWLADWERADGDALHRRAQDLVQQLDPMKQA